MTVGSEILCNKINEYRRFNQFMTLYAVYSVKHFTWQKVVKPDVTKSMSKLWKIKLIYGTIIARCLQVGVEIDEQKAPSRVT